MKMLLLLHLLGVGLWLGCIMVEVAFERALGGSADYRTTLAELHRKVDLWVELPAFLLVLATGSVMIANGAALSPLIIGKILLGSVAIAANIYCIWLVFERQRLALAGDGPGFMYVDHRQHQWGTLVLVAVVLALAAGLARLAA